MIVLRFVRIAAIALGLACVFALSREITLARGGEEVPGMSWAVGVLSLIFMGSAIFTERNRGPEASLQKDLLWGVAVGGIITVISRL